MSKRWVVVTGLGIVTPVCHIIIESWHNILAGNSGTAIMGSFDVSYFSVQFGGFVRNLDASACIDTNEL